MEPTTKKDCYSEITNAIVADLENGVRPWIKPWQTDGVIPCRPLRITSAPYRGINILLLWSAAHRQGFRSAYWLTYQQTRQLGAHVRKGEKSAMVVFAGSLTKMEKDDQGDDHEVVIPFLKTYSVFNVEQTDGLPEKFQAPAAAITVGRENERNERAEQFFRNTHADICQGGDRAYYSPLQDRIHMPDLHRFKNSSAFYAVLSHELMHWTSPDDRCPRRFRSTTFGTSNYAREELVAELGAAFLCADLGLSLTPRSDHAEYIAGWLDVLRNDKRAIFHAAAIAQKATDFLHSLQQTERSGSEAARKIA